MRDLGAKAWLALAVLAIVTALLLFVPAGTVRYWQPWVYLSIFTGASTLTTLYLLRKDRALLERRMRGGPTGETRLVQKLIMLCVSIGFIALLIVPALDHRFGWSTVPLVGVVAGNVLVAVGFYVIFLVYRENTFASATIQIAEHQKVISTGPYAIVRHPMYAGGLLYLLGTPLALGSYWGLRPDRLDAAVSDMATARRRTVPREESSRICRIPARGPVSPRAIRLVVRPTGVAQWVRRTGPGREPGGVTIATPTPGRKVVMTALAALVCLAVAPARADDNALAKYIGRWDVRVKNLQPKGPDVTYIENYQWVRAVQMITGPDVARSTVQPHQFLDFLSGRLASHFVTDRISLQRSLAERHRAPDANGRFRINNFFCHADSWQRLLPRLVEEGDAILMDLRGFAASNAGCIHELHCLVQSVPLDRCVLIVDETTDAPFLDRTLNEAWAELSLDSPNHGRLRHELTAHRFEPGAASVRWLVRRLCEAGA